MFKKALLLLAFSASAAFAQKPITAHDLWSLARVGNPAISPDGGTIAYTVTRYDLETFKSKTDIYTIPIGGGAPTLVTTGSSPSWSPAGQLAFTRVRATGLVARRHEAPLHEPGRSGTEPDTPEVGGQGL
jgi:dipeptidyl aminopeptidase/acylaminoacyl peptidase